MTLTLELPPEIEAKLGTEAEQQGLTLAEYALHKLTLGPKPIEEMTAGEYVLHLAEQFRDSMPEEEWNKLPSDYAINYEHYLHGAPKVTE